MLFGDPRYQSHFLNSADDTGPLCLNNLKATKRQRVRDLMKHPEQETVLEETYDELEADLAHRIEGLQHQLEMTDDRRNTMIRVNRAAKLAMDVFQEILEKEYGKEVTLITWIGSVIGAHSGPGTLALFFLGTER